MTINFKILNKDSTSRTAVLKTAHGNINTPTFMPVGTYGAIKGVKPEEIKKIGFDIILSNTYHLMERPGHELINKLEKQVKEGKEFPVEQLQEVMIISKNYFSIKSTFNSNFVVKNSKNNAQMHRTRFDDTTNSDDLSARERATCGRSRKKTAKPVFTPSLF
mgnify:CR=1 FL=1